MDLHGERRARRRVGLERIVEQQLEEGAVLEPRRARAGERARRGVRVGGGGDVEAGPVGRDRLEPREAAGARPRDRGAHVLAEVREPEPGGDALLPHALDAHDRRRPAAAELAHPAPVRALARCGEAVVDEQPSGAGGAQERRRVLVGRRGAAVGEHGILGRVAAEQRRERGDRAQVGEPRRDVRPLARVLALGEQPPERVEGLRGRDDPVRVVVDERDLAQYFSKCPCCSNPSSSAEYVSPSERRTVR